MITLEIAANSVVTVSIVLAGRNHVHTWWTGIVGCFLFAILYYRSALFADVVLQLFFVVTSVIGWWRWLHDDRQPQSRTARPITRASHWALGGMLLIAGVATMAYGAMLKHYTQAYAPMWDSAVLMFSVLAQCLLMQRCVESWPVWWVVNTVAVPLYASRGLYITAGLYLVYWVNAIVAWRQWLRLSRADVSASQSVL